MSWATADSVLASERYSYEPVNVLDGLPETSWVEGDRDAGIGTGLHLYLSATADGGKVDGAYRIAAVGMINGYAASESLYRANNRVKEATLSWRHALSADGTGEALWNLADTPEMQYFRFSEPVFMSELSLTIEDVYPGNRYDDTCIAEVVVIPARGKE